LPHEATYGRGNTVEIEPCLGTDRAQKLFARILSSKRDRRAPVEFTHKKPVQEHDPVAMNDHGRPSRGRLDKPVRMEEREEHGG
jgi:hypothetical protein